MCHILKIFAVFLNFWVQHFPPFYLTLCFVKLWTNWCSNKQFYSIEWKYPFMNPSPSSRVLYHSNLNLMWRVGVKAVSCLLIYAWICKSWIFTCISICICSRFLYCVKSWQAKSICWCSSPGAEHQFSELASEMVTCGPLATSKWFPSTQTSTLQKYSLY